MSVCMSVCLVCMYMLLCVGVWVIGCVCMPLSLCVSILCVHLHVTVCVPMGVYLFLSVFMCLYGCICGCMFVCVYVCQCQVRYERPPLHCSFRTYQMVQGITSTRPTFPLHSSSAFWRGEFEFSFTLSVKNSRSKKQSANFLVGRKFQSLVSNKNRKQRI